MGELRYLRKSIHYRRAAHEDDLDFLSSLARNITLFPGWVDRNYLIREITLAKVEALEHAKLLTKDEDSQVEGCEDIRCRTM